MTIIKSINNNIWQQREFNESCVAELCNHFKISNSLAKILSYRIYSIESAKNFLFPKIKNLLPNPFHIKDMKKAVDRIIDAINKKQKLCVFADYDVDGATAAALLKNLFRDLGYAIEIYVPDRLLEGYGPTEFSIKKIRDLGVDLIITVDCGTVAHEALAYAKKLSLEVIVIDHHLSTDVLPEAVGIINPNRFDEKSNYKNLAAVGVTFLFVYALLLQLDKLGYFINVNKPNLLQYLDLVALGTICDMVPVTELNRAFVYQGLKVMLLRKNLGIKVLCKFAGGVKKLDCYHLSFTIGPRINAGGRVGCPSLGVNLLSTVVESEAKALSKELERCNKERRDIENKIFEEALTLAYSKQNQKMLFIAGENWHSGVIGIIASRLKEKFNKPVAVISVNENIGKASCRSINGINFARLIVEALNNNLILLGGGHAMAAGFTVEKSKLLALEEFFYNLLIQNKTDNIGDTLEYDLNTNLSFIKEGLVEELSILEPYGNGNKEPLFKINSLLVLTASALLGKHINCTLVSKNNITIKAIAFHAINTPLGTFLLSKEKEIFSVIGNLKNNNWKNNKSIQLIIKDLIIEKDK